MGTFISKIYKPRIILILLLLIAAGLRYYTVFERPLIYDEIINIQEAKKISFDSKELYLPVGSEMIEHSLLSIYIVKFSFILFGDSKVAGRFFFVLLGIGGIYFIYRVVAQVISKEVGLLALFILVFSQFHIGETTTIREESLLLFSCALSIYFFFKAIRDGRKRWIYLTGGTIGLGFLGKEIILLMIPVFFIFVLLRKDIKKRFRVKDILISLLIMLIFISPHLLWKKNMGGCIYPCPKGSAWYEGDSAISMSIRSVCLYFAEIFPLLDDLNILFEYSNLEEREGLRFANDQWIWDYYGDNEMPYVHWILSIFIFMALFYCLQKKHRENGLICFSIIMFIFIFIVANFIGSGLHLGHWRASMTIYPGIILCAYMLMDLSKRKFYFKGITAILSIYLIFRSFYWINLPESMYAVPGDVYYKDCIARLREFHENGDTAGKRKIYKWVNDHYSIVTKDLENLKPQSM